MFQTFFFDRKLKKLCIYIFDICFRSKVTTPNVKSIFGFSRFSLKIQYKFIKDLYRVLSQNPENLKNISGYNCCSRYAILTKPSEKLIFSNFSECQIFWEKYSKHSKKEQKSMISLYKPLIKSEVSEGQKSKLRYHHINNFPR